MKTAGILALQGDFEAHRKAVERAGGRALEVRTLADLQQCDGLIIPGGESTTMLKLLDQEGLTEPLKRFSEHKPVYGSCAGAILLAREVTGGRSTAALRTFLWPRAATWKRCSSARRSSAG